MARGRIERELLSKIVAERDIHHVVESGIKREFFQDQQNRQVWDAILKHKGRYGEVPTVKALRQDFPDYDFIKVPDSMEFLVDKMREHHTEALLEGGLAASAEAYDKGDLPAALAAIAQVQRQIAADIPHGRDTNLTETGAARLARYEELRNLPDGLRGIATGFPTIDRATSGLQDGQLITFVGPPKSGKSTMLLLAAMAAHKTAHRPLFIGFEMSNYEQEERFDAFSAGISHTRLRNGTLTARERELLTRAIKRQEMMPDFILSSDSMSATTVSGVQAKIERYEPDVVFVDGVYMMDDELGEPKGSAQALTNISRSLKRMALNLDLPICISTQVLESKMSKGIVTSSSVGYSSSFAQDSDVMFATQNTEDPEVKVLKVLLSRNCPPLEAYSKWDWEQGKFEEIPDPWDEEGEGGF
jgi:replicative DNA helicase